ncbi:MAG: alpha/beta hydrolase [Actinobacteria bacterium]|nr:alpha/beta hydrolase [Actinomycetota bacterium]
MRVTSTDGVEIEVHDLGGDGPPLVLAHATGFHGRVWEPLAAHLTGFHLWSIDMRAHGDSDAPRDRPLEWYGFADDVLSVIDGIGLERPYGVGHSKGAASLLLAEQARPGTFTALYLYEPVVVPTDNVTGHNPDNPLSNGARRRRDTFDSFDAAYENYASKPPFNTLHPEVLRVYVDHGFTQNVDGTVSLKCRPENEAEVYAHGMSHHAFAALHDVRCPVTIAMGVEDGVPAIFGRPIAEALPHGTIASFPDLAHFGPLEDPATIATSVLEAFSQVN